MIILFLVKTKMIIHINNPNHCELEYFDGSHN